MGRVARSAVLLAAAPTLIVGACATDPIVEQEAPVTFQLDGHFDEARPMVVIVGQNDTFTVNDSLRATLVVERISTLPWGHATIEKCGVTCYGYTQTTPAPGARSGDSLIVASDFEPLARLTLRGVHRGDSIVGTMTSWRQRAPNVRYTGRFIARRK